MFTVSPCALAAPVVSPPSPHAAVPVSRALAAVAASTDRMAVFQFFHCAVMMIPFYI